MGRLRHFDWVRNSPCVPSEVNWLPAVDPEETKKLLTLNETGWTSLDSLGTNLIETEPDPEEVAEACYRELGYRPLSFAFPLTNEIARSTKRFFVAPMVPGLPYLFDNSCQYYRTYSQSFWGVTHRRVGWDCFRHVEIIGSGALPLMVDADLIPRYSMIHYPRRTMVQIWRRFVEEPFMPDRALSDFFRDHFHKHLTTLSSAGYLLDQVGFGPESRVLFVDPQLPYIPDYQSLMTLIGLKQLLGPNCHTYRDVDYLYSDWAESAGHLYGRGFGYARSLPKESRGIKQKHPRARGLKGLLRQGDYDLVVVGSMVRNRQIAERLLQVWDPQRTVWIHGEDSPISQEDVSLIRTSGVHAFVRQPRLFEGHAK
jgi:hypothetical protein